MYLLDIKYLIIFFFKIGKIAGKNNFFIICNIVNQAKAILKLHLSFFKFSKKKILMFCIIP